MNATYEIYLRKDIYPFDQKAVDLICDIYDTDQTERHYISLVMEDYINGANAYQTWKRLQGHIVLKYKRQYECMGKFLDDEYKNKMKGGK